MKVSIDYGERLLQRYEFKIEGKLKPSLFKIMDENGKELDGINVPDGAVLIAEKAPGIYSYLIYSAKSAGFGGDGWPVQLTNGKTFEPESPAGYWSSRASIMNDRAGLQCVDCSIDGCAGYMIDINLLPKELKTTKVVEPRWGREITYEMSRK